MNKKNIIKAAAIFSIFACATISCTSEDSTASNALPDGKYPLELKASNISVAQSRATVDGSWSGGETIGLMVSGDNSLYSYTADASGNLTSTAPYYWKATDDITVTAWYPYSASTDGTTFTHSVNQDQSSDTNYAASDLITATNQTISFASEKKELTFSHETAKITVTLEAGDGVTADELTSATISISDGTQYITSHNGSAIIAAPTTLNASTDFMKVTIGKGDFYYTLTENTTFAKGNVYNYTIKVNKTGLSVTAKISSWNNTDENGDENEENGNADMSDFFNTVNVGDYYTCDGMVYASSISSSELESVKDKIIGIVFYVGQDGSGDGTDYSSTGIGIKNCHGYVVALTDCVDENGDIAHLDWGDAFGAANKYTYNGMSAPSISSGWFLPNITLLEKLVKLESDFFSVGGNILDGQWYWSSTANYYAMVANSGMTTTSNKNNDSANKWIRAILAF